MKRFQMILAMLLVATVAYGENIKTEAEITEALLPGDKTGVQELPACVIQTHFDLDKSELRYQIRGYSADQRTRKIASKRTAEKLCVYH